MVKSKIWIEAFLLQAQDSAKLWLRMWGKNSHITSTRHHRST